MDVAAYFDGLSYMTLRLRGLLGFWEKNVLHIFQPSYPGNPLKGVEVALQFFRR